MNNTHGHQLRGYGVAPRARLRAFAAAATLPLVFAVAGPAHAEGETNIDYVEVGDDGTVTVLLATDGIPAGQPVGADSVKVSVDGTSVDASAKPVATGEIERTSVLAIDASNSMKGPRFESAKAAAKAFIEAAPDDVAIGLVTFAGEVKDVIEPSTDHAALITALDGITLTNGTSVYDAMSKAIDVAGDDGARSILLLSDGKDQGKGSSLDDVVAEASAAGVIVDAVSLDQGADQMAALDRMTSSSGGTVISSDTAALAEVFTARANALGQALLVSFPQPEGDFESASLKVSVEAGGATYTDEALVSLGTTEGTAVKVVKQGKSLLGTGGLLLGGLALAIGLGILLSIVLTGATKGRSLAQRQIAMYTDGTRPTDGKSRRKDTSAAMPSIRETALAMTDKVVKGDFETRLVNRLQGAGSALTASEWLLLHSGIAVAAGIVGLVLRGPALMAVMFLLGAALPYLFLKIKHGRRLAAFNSQLAETLQLLAGGLSAGLSMPQAIDTVVQEGAEPMAGELRRALVEQRLGVEISDALDGIAERMESQDFAWVVMAIRIQREVGGNLAELLNTVADTLRERDYLRRQVRVLSAEGRVSAYVLGALPIVMFIYLLLTKPDFITPLFTQTLGIMMLGLAVLLLGIGFFWLSRIVKVEV